MFPFFHVFVPLLVLELTGLTRKWNLQRLALVVGLMLPDLIEKPIDIVNPRFGRNVFHSLLFLGLLVGVTLAVRKAKGPQRGSTRVMTALSLGTAIHLLLDLPYVPFFAPFVDYSHWWDADDALGAWIHSLLTEPVVQVTEAIGVACAGVLVAKFHLYRYTALKAYLLRDHLATVTLAGSPSTAPTSPDRLHEPKIN